MINYTKFFSDPYSYAFCTAFLQHNRQLSLARRNSAITMTSYAWTEMESDAERFMTDPEGLSADEAVAFFQRKVQTLYKWELVRTFPSVTAIREFWVLLDDLWHQETYSFSVFRSALLAFWDRWGMKPNRHDAGMVALTSKLLNLMEPLRWPIWDIRRDSAFFGFSEGMLRSQAGDCYRALFELAEEMLAHGHSTVYIEFMRHLLALHAAPFPSPEFPPLVVFHVLTKWEHAIGLLATTPALRREWTLVRRYLAMDRKGAA